VRAVRGVDISIAPGETVALLGPNGAGKTTTIDMMLGLLPPDSGTVSVFGMAPADAIKAGAIGGLLQTGGVIEYLTVRELITFVASLYPKPADCANRSAALVRHDSSAYAEKPLGVEEVIELTDIGDIANRRTTKLSGGQTQRLRFAIALVSNPDVLVFDEPTVALDVEARCEFWSTMARRLAERGDDDRATAEISEVGAHASHARRGSLGGQRLPRRHPQR
jgi:ABC-2 type transport system ATP-binding protein